MHNFKLTVPAKVYRHVIKAVKYLLEQEDNYCAPLEEIQVRVRHTIRNCIPVPDLDNVIIDCINNYVWMEVLTKLDDGYVFT